MTSEIERGGERGERDSERKRETREIGRGQRESEREVNCMCISVK